MAIDVSTPVCETVDRPRRVTASPRRATAGWPATSPMVESIVDGDQTLAMIIRAQVCPDKTTFLTQPEWKQQVGFVVYPAGGEIARHVHRPLERQIVGTSEVLIVKQGRCEVDIYNNDRVLVVSRELRAGDVMLMVGGGHGFRMLEDTVFLEVKQGPYTGTDEKECF
jgi:uncharacterized protein with PhoU and TrkA domain